MGDRGKKLSSRRENVNTIPTRHADGSYCGITVVTAMHKHSILPGFENKVSNLLFETQGIQLLILQYLVYPFT